MRKIGGSLSRIQQKWPKIIKKAQKNNGVIKKKNMFILKKVKISRLNSKYYFENKVEMCRLQLFFRIQQLLQLLYPLQKPCVDELVKQPDQLSYDARGCYHQNPGIGVLIWPTLLTLCFFHLTKYIFLHHLFNILIQITWLCLSAKRETISLLLKPLLKCDFTNSSTQCIL